LKAEVEEEFKMLAMKDSMINEAYCKLQVMSDDEAIRMLYQARLKAQRDEFARIQGARQDGRQDGWRDGLDEGERKGEQNKVIEIARKMKARGRSFEEITEDTGLLLEEITRL
jgi:predicted transposase/invertase (TIGR01784 family)